jgi:hypothetical protein
MSEEPQFFRIRAELYGDCAWVSDVKPGISVSLAVSEKPAKIFLGPAKDVLEYIKFAIGSYTLEPATYAEWIEQDPTREQPK